jgi:hypothetical protein
MSSKKDYKVASLSGDVEGAKKGFYKIIRK